MILFQQLLKCLGVNRVSGHTFFPSLVSKLPVILDCGSHLGAFLSDGAKTIFKVGGKAVCVEANPRLAELLQEAPPLNARIVHAAIIGDETCQQIELNLSSNPEASSLFSEVSDSFGTEGRVSVPCVTLSKLVRMFDGDLIDIVKMDVEGAENGVLLGADPEDLSRIMQLCVEFHDVISPEMRPAVDRVRQRLKSLGFAEVNANWPYTDDIVFVNKSAVRSAGVALRMRIRLSNAAFMLRGFLCRIIQVCRTSATG